MKTTAGATIGGGLSPTLCCGAHNGCQPKIIVYEERRSNTQGPPNITRGGCYLTQTERFFYGGLEGLSRTLTTNAGEAGVCVEHLNEKDMAKIYRIRKLTPRECFRLMGVKDDDISKIDNYPLVPNENGDFIAPEGLDGKELKKLQVSESQQYKMAGNSIVVDVLKGVFTQMFRKDAEALF